MRGIALLPLLGVVLAGCNQQSTTPAAEQAAFDLPADQVAYAVRHNLTQDGIRRAVLNSDTAYAFEDTREFDLIGVAVTFYDEAGRVAGTLTSRTGEYNLAEGLFVARDSVVLVSQGPQGERVLASPELFFDVRSDRLWSDLPFTLEENGRTSRGQTFRSDSRFETWEVTGIQTTGTVDDDEGLTF